MRRLLFDPSGTRLLTVCGTFRRPALFSSMFKSFLHTKSETTNLMVYLSEDDPLIEDYLALEDSFSYVIGPHRFFAEAVNHVVMEDLPGIAYYQAINDDHIYHTMGWDGIMARSLESKVKGWGWAFPNDMVNDGKLNLHGNPSSEVFSWKLVRALGYVYPKEFRQFGVDEWARRFLGAINGSVYVPEVEIEHLCAWATGKIAKDENSYGVYSDAAISQGYEVAERWFQKEGREAFKRIAEAKAVIG